jgi:DNA-binding transcriptional MerR regulator
MATRIEHVAAATFPVRVATRVTGLKPELIRAWESRYGAIQPHRTAGGSRRYSRDDLARLNLLREVVEAGHRIGKVARLDDDSLRRLLPEPEPSDASVVDRILSAVERMDSLEVRRILTAELAERGPVEFATGVVLPMLVEVGNRWERDQLGVATEHFLTAIARAILVPVFDDFERSEGAPTLVFATPSGETHDLGTLVAAIVAANAGARVVFLGADMPQDDILACALDQRAAVVVLGLLTISPECARDQLLGLREGLPKDVELWIGGAGIDSLPPQAGVERIPNLDQLTARTTQLSLRASSPSLAPS